MATAEVKLRTLAAANATLQSYLGTPPAVFRWWDTQHVQGSVLPGVTVRRVSTAIDYRMTPAGNNINSPRFQIDVRDPDPEHGRLVAAAIIAFLNALNLAVTGGTVTGKQAPSFVLNIRDGLDYNLTPPVWTQSLDVRLYNLEE
jgi:hypothetical protein